MRLKDIGEFGLIERFKAFQAPGVLRAIGEDCAVFSLEGLTLLFTADTMVEGVHFKREYASAWHIGFKALSVNLSDIAACGGRPLFYLVALTVSPEEDVGFVEDLYRGMKEAGERFGVGLVGGDLSRGDRLSVTVALLGVAEEGKWVPRDGAEIGHWIYVSGHLGESALGLKLLEIGQKEGPFVRKHLMPEPRVALGLELSKGRLASAMIDISDGFLKDLGHLLEASSVGAEVYVDKLPLSEPMKETAKAYGIDPLELALSGGEDYELLFTSPLPEGVLRKLGAKLGVPISVVGRTAPSGLTLIKGGKRWAFEGKRGFDHFG